ncbi:MAG: SH3 domain-containing protein [Tannerella sp.]|jgi:hypothetical protein|nr:SH3 domain-containing protein [Tannerella sp.]
MKTRIYITALSVAAAMTAGAQDYYGKESPYIRPAVYRMDGNIPQDRDYRNISPKKRIDGSYLNNSCRDQAYHPYSVTVKALAVRSAPSHSAPVLTTIPGGEVIHLADGNYPWKSMRITYFDTEAWTYRTAVGYVNSQYIRSPAPASTGRAEAVTANIPLYTDRPRHDTAPGAHPIVDRTYAAADLPTTIRPQTGKKGRVTIWTDCEDDGHIDVYIDGEYAGKLTSSFYRSTPMCSEDGTLVRELSAGRHDLSAFGATRIWSGEVTVAPEQCILKQLTAY